MHEKIRVLVSGSEGKMGKEVVALVKKTSDFELAAAIDIAYQTTKVEDQIYCGNKYEEGIVKTIPDVIVDFTHPNSVKSNILTALKHKTAIVVGTTGLTEKELIEIDELAKENNTGVLIAPNFALGAVVMMEVCKLVSKYFNEAEIIEMHNPLKADSPSGTALKTAEEIAKNRLQAPEIFDKSPARGLMVKDIPVHSVRLSGLVAHQQVIFGAEGQSLSIRHDSYNRTSFMPGVEVAIRGILKTNGLIYGLEKLL